MCRGEEEEEEELEVSFADNLKTAGGAVAFLLTFIGCGAWFFSVFEEDLSFFDAFYFTFITMLARSSLQSVSGAYTLTRQAGESPSLFTQDQDWEEGAFQTWSSFQLASHRLSV